MFFPKRIQAIFLFFLLLTPLPLNADSDTIEIRNLGDSEILNIRVDPGKSAKPFFLRLDLLPGAADKFVNPALAGTLRVDTGLEILDFPKVDFRSLNRISFCQAHDDCLITEAKNGDLRHIEGKAESLLPKPGSHPVCQLDQFRPRMAMSEVCGMLDPATPRDDNGAWLTGLGFANLLWAARLVPSENEKMPSGASLEHLELRRPLQENECNQILSELFSKGYAPWQAEFPGMDIDFAELPGHDAQARQKLLRENMDRFLSAHKSSARAPQINNVADEEGEARILLAPGSSMPQLANADDPTGDVQLITMILKPLSHTLLLDVSAYAGGKNAEN